MIQFYVCAEKWSSSWSYVVVCLLFKVARLKIMSFQKAIVRVRFCHRNHLRRERRHANYTAHMCGKQKRSLVFLCLDVWFNDVWYEIYVGNKRSRSSSSKLLFIYPHSVLSIKLTILCPENVCIFIPTYGQAGG